jgi:hypothetical protein
MKKKRINSGKKGRAFEIKICETLSLWWSNGKRKDIFWHTHGSGNRATVRAKKGKQTPNSAGDVMALDPIGQPLIDFAIIELKKGYNKELDILEILDGKKKKTRNILLDWFKKAEQEREFHGKKEVFIIFQRDRKKICIAVDQGFASKCFLTSAIEIMTKSTNINIFLLEDFLKEIKPSTMKERYI